MSVETEEFTIGDPLCVQVIKDRRMWVRAVIEHGTMADAMTVDRSPVVEWDDGPLVEVSEVLDEWCHEIRAREWIDDEGWVGYKYEHSVFEMYPVCPGHGVRHNCNVVEGVIGQRGATC